MDPENLRAVPVFSELTDEELRRIATFANEDSVSAGATLIREGDYSNEMIAIESGTADVKRDGATVAQVGPGDVVGELGVLEKGHAQRVSGGHVRHAPDPHDQLGRGAAAQGNARAAALAGRREAPELVSRFGVRRPSAGACSRLAPAADHPSTPGTSVIGGERQTRPCIPQPATE